MAGTGNKTHMSFLRYELLCSNFASFADIILIFVSEAHNIF